MRRINVLLAAVAALTPISVVVARPQTAPVPAAPGMADQFTLTRVMVPMKDGAKMETVIIAPLPESPVDTAKERESPVKEVEVVEEVNQ